MKILSHVLQFGTRWVSAVAPTWSDIYGNPRSESSDTRIVAHECIGLWIAPEDESYFSERWLTDAALNSIYDLLRIVSGADTKYTAYAHNVRYKILTYFFTELEYEDAEWHFSIRPNNDGHWLIWVVVGHTEALAHLYSTGRYTPQETARL